MKRIIRFGYNVKVPEGIPLVDCRVIKNPYTRKRHNAEGGLLRMREMVRMDPHFMTVVQQAVELLKKHDVIGIGCSYGVHRSGTVIQEMQRRVSYGYIEKFVVEKIGKEAA